MRIALPPRGAARALSGRPEPDRWKRRWLLYLLGAGTAFWGVIGLIRDADRTDPINWAIFFVGAILGHDLLIAPLVLLTAWFGVRRIPSPYRAPVQAGAIVSGALTLLALPVVLGLGRRADVPSQLPLPYGRNLLILLAMIWAGVAVMVLAARLRRPDGRAVEARRHSPN